MPQQKRKYPVKIVSCLWGDWPHGENLGVEYCNRMARALKRNLTVPYEYIVLTDNAYHTCCASLRDEIKFDPSITVLAIKLHGPAWPGCLSKLSVHAPDYDKYLTGRVLLIDLDTIITGNIDDFANYSGQLATRMAFREPGQSGGDLIAFEHGGELSKKLWKKISSSHDELIRITDGRERYVYRKMTPQPEFWHELFPGQYVSYKRDIRPKNNKLPDNARLVSCHGLNTNGPRPHHLLEQGLDWVEEHWA